MWRAVAILYDQPQVIAKKWNVHPSTQRIGEHWVKGLLRCIIVIRKTRL